MAASSSQKLCWAIVASRHERGDGDDREQRDAGQASSSAAWPSAIVNFFS